MEMGQEENGSPSNTGTFKLDCYDFNETMIRNRNPCTCKQISHLFDVPSDVTIPLYMVRRYR